MIMDQENHQRVECVKGNRETGLKVNLPTFKTLHLLGNDFAEIELTKTRQKLNLPVQFGLVKEEKILEWYYDFLHMFVDRSDFETNEMEPDSDYFDITAPSLKQVIKPETKMEFDMRIHGSCHKQNLPVQIGFAILQNAKLKLLVWYYDFLDIFVDKSDFEKIEMDTDSEDFAITAPSLKQVIKPETKFGMRIHGSCHEQKSKPLILWCNGYHTSLSSFRAYV